MKKTLTLTKSNIKSFIRNKKLILLLFILPIIMILLVFLSFNPEGLKHIPIGVIIKSDTFDINNFRGITSNFLIIKEFDNLENCLYEVRNYERYGCMEIFGEGQIIINFYFDNTREPIIWEIVQKLKNSVDILQKNKFSDLAFDLSSRLHYYNNKIEKYQENLRSANSKIDYYISYIDGLSKNLEESKYYISYSFNEIENDISEIKEIKSKYDSERKYFYINAISKINDIESYYSIDLGELKSQITEYNNYGERYSNEIDEKIGYFEKIKEEGKNYLSDVDLTIKKLEELKNQMKSYKNEIQTLENDIYFIKKDFNSLLELNPNTLFSPVAIENKPIYSPTPSKNEKFSIKIFNFIELQTLYPNILFLITLFLSFLISIFISITYINSSVTQRTRIIDGIFFSEIFSIYLSTIIIISIPLGVVLFIGNFLFKIPIILHITSVSIILFLTSTNFTFLGISLSYLIKNESITLLVSTFFLVLLIFLSGILLPIERMGRISAAFASAFPPKFLISSKIRHYNF